jgi:hypothetical protein
MLSRQFKLTTDASLFLFRSHSFKKSFSKLTASISIITSMRLILGSLFLAHYAKNAYESGHLAAKVALLRHAQEAIENDPSKGKVICNFCYVRATRTGASRRRRELPA